jgi:Lipase (class 3)
MSAIAWTTAIKYALLVQIAEGVLPSAEYSPADIAAIEKGGYCTYLQTLYGNELATDVSPHTGETVTYGFLALSAAKELVAILRGTDTINEWIHDAAFLMLPNPIHSGAGLTEDGFTAIYRSLRVGRDPKSTCAVASIAAYVHAGQAQTVTVAGHSLGGALATLLTMDVALNTEYRTPTVYTYASPRVGDHYFAGSFNKLKRCPGPGQAGLLVRSQVLPGVPIPIALRQFEFYAEELLQPLRVQQFPLGPIANDSPVAHHDHAIHLRQNIR